MTPGRLWPVATLALALVAVGLTGEVERSSDAVAVYNNECRTPAGGRCVEPREAAGLPFAFVFDTPGVSVEHQVSIVEDEARAGPFLAGVALVWMALCAAGWFASRRAPGRLWDRVRARRACAVGVLSAVAMLVAAFAVRTLATDPVLDAVARPVVHTVLAASWPIADGLSDAWRPIAAVGSWAVPALLCGGVGAAAGLVAGRRSDPESV